MMQHTPMPVPTFSFCGEVCVCLAVYRGCGLSPGSQDGFRDGRERERERGGRGGGERGGVGTPSAL